MFVGRVALKYIGAMAGIAIVALSLFILIMMNSDKQGRLGTWKARVETFISGTGDKDDDPVHMPDTTSIRYSEEDYPDHCPQEATI